MTEKREAQQRLEESREQLFQSQKMEALGQLTGGLAHDFNNLLTAILGACELALAQSRRSGARLKRMLDGVRSSAQRGATSPSNCSPSPAPSRSRSSRSTSSSFLGDVTTLVRPSLRSNIEVVTEISDQLWPVDADAGALELALAQPRLQRARRDDGRRRRSRSARTTWCSTGEPEGLRGEHVALKVSDTGTGMTREVMERVFEPFFTTKSFGEGTGLGLSQVFGFAKQIGGADHGRIRSRARARPSRSTCRPASGAARER